jgi:hypothetical protein
MDLLSCILAGHIGSTEARSPIIANELLALWFGLWTLFLVRYARKYAQTAQVPLQFPCCLGEVSVVHDVVAVEYAPGLVPGNRHRGFLVNAGRTMFRIAVRHRSSNSSPSRPALLRAAAQALLKLRTGLP